MILGLETWAFILLMTPILFLQSITLFLDARRKGASAWFWGVWGLIQFPMPLLFYYLVVVIPYRKNVAKREGK